MVNNIPQRVLDTLNEVCTEAKVSEEIYGKTTMQFIKNKWYVCITVPSFLREKVGLKQIKTSTGTSDSQIALLLKALKSRDLYAKLAYADFHQDAYGTNSEYDV